MLLMGTMPGICGTMPCPPTGIMPFCRCPLPICWVIQVDVRSADAALYRIKVEDAANGPAINDSCD